MAKVRNGRDVAIRDFRRRIFRLFLASEDR